MKKTLFVLLFTLNFFRTLAEGYLVPAAIALQGRGAVYAHIHSKIDSVDLRVWSDTVPAPTVRTVGRAELIELGFKNGTFTELARVLGEVSFDAGQLVTDENPAPLVYVAGSGYDSEGREIFGGGSSSRPETQKGGGYKVDGDLWWRPTVGEVRIPAGDFMENGGVVEMIVSTAMNYGSQTRWFYRDEEGNFTIPIGLLTEGQVTVVTAGGGAWAYKLGAPNSILNPILGEELLVAVRRLRSQTFFTYTELMSKPEVYFWFDRRSGRIFGEFPVIEVEAYKPADRVVRLNTGVPVNNHPDGKVFRTPNRLVIKSSKVGDVIDIPIDPNASHYEIVIPAGDDIYQLFFTYPDVEDWSSVEVDG